MEIKSKVLHKMTSQNNVEEKDLTQTGAIPRNNKEYPLFYGMHNVHIDSLEVNKLVKCNINIKRLSEVRLP